MIIAIINSNMTTHFDGCMVWAVTLREIQCRIGPLRYYFSVFFLSRLLQCPIHAVLTVPDKSLDTHSYSRCLNECTFDWYYMYYYYYYFFKNLSWVVLIINNYYTF